MNKSKLLRKVLTGAMALALVCNVYMPLPVKAAETRLTIPKFENAPTIDGKVSAEEWGEKLFTVADGEENIAVLDEGGVFPASFTADIYMGYDNTHIYLAAVTEYDVHKNEALLPSDLWAGDCMQIQISSKVGTDRNELGFCLNSLTNKQQAVAWASTGTFNMEGGEGQDYLVYRDGTTTVYEIALGVEQFSGLTELPDGMTLPFSLSFHMSGGGFLEYASGIVQAKDITKAALIGLGTEPDESAIPPVEEGGDTVNVNNNLLDSKDATGNRTAPGVIEAEDYNELYGTEIHAADCPDGGQNLGWTADRDYMVYKNVNFTAVPEKVDFRVSGTGTPNVQIRLDSVDGTKIVDFAIEASGDWDTYITTTADVENAADIVGTHDVYLLINGGMNINWFEFIGGDAPAVEAPAEEAPSEEAPSEEAPAEESQPQESKEDKAPVSAPVEESAGVNVVVIVVVVVVVVAIIAGAVVVVSKKKKTSDK